MALCTACMIDHWGVVSRQRSSVSYGGSVITSASPVSKQNRSPSMKTRLHTIQPCLLMPPPRAKYIGGAVYCSRPDNRRQNGRAALGLRDGAMVHPHKDVLFALAGRAERDGLVVCVQRDRGAGCVETDAADRFSFRTGLAEGGSNCSGTGFPDIVGRLLDKVGSGSPHSDRKRCTADLAPVHGEKPGTRAARANVAAEKQ